MGSAAVKTSPSLHFSLLVGVQENSSGQTPPSLRHCSYGCYRHTPHHWKQRPHIYLRTKHGRKKQFQAPPPAHVSHAPPYTCLFSLSFISTDSRPLPSSVGTPSLCGSHVWGVFQRFLCCCVGFRESVWNALCCSVLVLCHLDCIPRSTDSVFRPLIAVFIVLCAYLLLCVSRCCWNIFLRLLFACSFFGSVLDGC